MEVGGSARLARRRFVLVAAAACVAVATFAPCARAQALSADERLALERGDVVKRAYDPDLPGGGYVGCLSYVVIRAPPDAVTRALLDATTYRATLPLTLAAYQVARRGQDRWVYLEQGGRLGTVEYTALVRPSDDGTVRFWLDPDYPHDVDDAWGFFRVEARPDGRTLLSYGAVVELGHGLVWLLFRERIRRHALETPRLVRRWVEDHVAAPPAQHAP